MAEAKIKKAIRDRDGRKCVKCGLSERAHKRRYGQSLHVHRLVEGGEYSLENGQSLCLPCHHAVHGRTFTWRPKEKTRKITVTLPAKVLEDLKWIAAYHGWDRPTLKTGIYRAAGIARRCLEEHNSDGRQEVRQLPPDGRMPRLAQEAGR